MPDITISEGSTLEVDYEVENAGDGDGDQDILLEVQNALEDTDANVSLAPGGTATGTLAWPTQDGDAVTNAIAEVVSDDSTDGITVTVEPPYTLTTYDFDGDSLGGVPAPWTDVSGNNDVSNEQAFSGSQSMRFRTDSGQRFIETTWTPDQYTETFGFAYYETANNSNIAFALLNGDGDPLIYLGSTNPAVVAEGDSYNTLLSSPSPQYDTWRRFEVSVDWSTNNAVIDWYDEGGSSSNQSLVTGLKNVNRYDIGGVAFRNAGDNTTDWGGSGQDCWVDDVLIIDE